ncbi:hypothetical protein [Roseovarius salis]|uniref:hypothetical protein n=1 Tax=Roseovarius salis TaxID=3376063 RepID=UPI0037C72A01
MISDLAQAWPAPLRAVFSFFLHASHPAFPPHHAPASRPVPRSRTERTMMAFREIPLNGSERQALCALLDAPGSTSAELSRQCGWMASGWRTQMMLLCQRRRRYFWPEGLAPDATQAAILAALVDYRSDTLSFTPRLDLAHILHEIVESTGPAA